MSHGAPPIEPLLVEVRKLGLLVNNLYQMNAGFWVCNVRSRDGLDFYEFGTGPDAAGAIESALVKVEGGKKSPRLPAPDYDRPVAQTPAMPEDEDLIG
jgi:hypothetical protein